MSDTSLAVAICPVFGFTINGTLIGTYSHEEITKYFENLSNVCQRGFKISSRILLRRITPEDIQNLRNNRPDLELSGTFPEITMQTFVLEFTPTENEDYENTVNTVLLALRLQKAGNVYSNIIWHKNDTLLVYLPWIRVAFPYTIRNTPPVNYVMRVEDIELVARILRKIEKTDFIKTPSFRIACERLSRCYEERRWDDKIIDLAVAFEALFIEGNKGANVPAGELIGLGCSMLIGKTAKERKNIKDFLNKAFALRNNIVHGSEIKMPTTINGKSYDEDEFVLQLEDFLRDSLKKLLT